MHVYHIPPIDSGWEQLQSVAETAGKLGAIKAERAASGRNDHEPSVDADQFLADWESAKTLAKAKGWEGDFRHDPVVFWLPTEDRFQYGFAFKQDNNGSTFVIAPVAIPWLAKL